MNIKKPLLTTVSIFLLFFAIKSAKAADITYTVDNTSDNSGQACTSAASDCSLRSALELANAYPNSATDKVTIQFDSSLTSGTISVASQLELTRGNTDIIGLGVDNLTLDFSSYASNNEPMFYVHGVDKDNLISDIYISNLYFYNDSLSGPNSYLEFDYAENITLNSSKTSSASNNRVNPHVYLGEFLNNITISSNVFESTNYKIASATCETYANESYDLNDPENDDFRDCLPNNLLIDNNDFNSDAFNLFAGYDLTISNNNISGSSNTIGNFIGVDFINNTINLDDGYSIYFTNSSSLITTTNVLISNNDFTSVYLDSGLIIDDAENIQILSNTNMPVITTNISGSFIFSGNSSDAYGGSLRLTGAVDLTDLQIINNSWTVSSYEPSYEAIEIPASGDIANCLIDNNTFLGVGINVTGSSFASNFIVSNNTFLPYNFTTGGIYFNAPIHDITIYNNTLDSSGSINVFSNFNDLSITYNTVNSATGGGIRLATLIGNDVTIENNIINTTDSTGLYFRDIELSGDFLISDNQISYTSTNGIVLDFENSTTTSTLITNNTIIGATEYGVYLGDSFSDATFDSNTVQDSSFGTSEKYAISLHPLSFNGTDYISDQNPSTTLDAIYFNGRYITANDTLLSTNEVDNIFNNGGLTMVLGTINAGAGVAEPTTLLFYNNSSITDYASCNTALSTVGTCEAIKVDYFDTSGTDVVWTGLDDFETTNGTSTTYDYYTSFHSLSYNGVDYLNDPYGGTNLFYQNNNGVITQFVSANDTLMNSEIIADAQSAGGFMAVLISANFGAGFVHTTIIMPNGGYGISDLASCGTVVGGIGTCEAVKLDYFDYDSGTEEFTWTGFTGFETAGGTVALASGFTGDPYLDLVVTLGDTIDFATGYTSPAYITKVVVYPYAAYYVQTANNTFTNETIDNVANGFIFDGLNAENNTISDSEISALYSAIQQVNTDSTDENYLDNTNFGDVSDLDIQSGLVDVNYDISLYVTDQSLVPVPGATVNLEDAYGNPIDFGTTNADGYTATYSLDAFTINSTGVVSDYNPYTYTYVQDDFVSRERTFTISSADLEINANFGPNFGGLNPPTLTMANHTPSEASGAVSVEFNIGDAVDGIPIGGGLVFTFPDNFIMNDIANLTANITSLTDDGVDIRANINTATLIDNVITITIKNEDIEKQSNIYVAFDSSVIDQNPSQNGQYAIQLTTEDELDSTLDTGYVLADINSNTNLTITVQEALVMTIDNNSINLNVDPSVNNGEDYSQKNVILVRSNAEDGYVIQGELQDNEEEARLKSDNGYISTGDAINNENLFGYIAYNNDDGSIAKNKSTLQSEASSAASFLNYANGLKLYNGTENGVGFSSKTNLYAHVIYYVLNVDYETPAGIYSGTIIYTALPSF